MMMREYLDAMAIDAARNVLDLGCGTGVVARAIARRPRFAGRAMGVDRSPHLVAAASRLAREEGIGERVAFRTGDSHTLALRDMEFDAVVAHTLFSHLEDPRSVLTEIVRVLEPGGKVGIFDGDYASMTFASDDPAAGKATDEMIINAIVTNPRVMRQMPQLLQEAGLRLMAAFSYVVADIGRADFWDSSVRSLIRLLPKAGAMTQSQAEAWAAAMLARSEQGTFFGASNYYGFVAMKPSGPGPGIEED
jgi:ubiquinone/menaquinone biosynthesis C-methylase UbiE